MLTRVPAAAAPLVAAPRKDARAERMLDALALVLSDVRYGLGAYLSVYLVAYQGWDAASVGFALSFGGITGLVVQGPLSALVDRVEGKRQLLAASVAVVTATCLAIPLAPRFWPVALCGVIGALAGTVISPVLAAISLGIVGPRRFAGRACRNEGLFHFGNGLVNVAILLTAPFFGTPVLFWAMGLTALASVAAAFAVPRGSIDHALARGLLPDDPQAPVPSLQVVLASRPLLMFAACGALFHLANGAMLGLLAQKLALSNPGQGIALTAASAIAAQCVMVPAAVLAARRADAWGRRPLLLAAFAALAVRGVLYAALTDPAWLIAGQVLDGVAAGLLGALFPVVIADLTEGAGCFGGAQGVVGTVHGVGGVVSGALAGWIASTAGYDAAFLTLAFAAAAGGALFWAGMPETAGAGRIARRA